MIATTIENSHCAPNKCHGGIAKTLERLRSNFYWPSMVVDVKSFISKCEVCQQTKAQNKVLRPPMIAQHEVHRPFQKLYIDFLGPYPRSKKGNIGLLIVLDHFTKFPLLHPIRKFTTDLVCGYLKEQVFTIFGTPEAILSDNGSQFKSTFFSNFLKERGVKHIVTAVYSPQANASERVNRSIIAGIRAYLPKDQSNWDKHVYEIAEALRSGYHQTIGCTPYYGLFGQQMISHGKEYQLLRKLEMLSNFEQELNSNDRLKIIRSEFTRFPIPQLCRVTCRVLVSENKPTQNKI